MFNIVGDYSILSNQVNQLRVDNLESLVDDYSIIEPDNQLEEIEKEVALIYLNSVLNQDSRLTTEEVNHFVEIIEDEPLFHSSKIFIKLLLPDCIDIEFFNPAIEREAEPASLFSEEELKDEKVVVQVVPNPSFGKLRVSSSHPIAEIIVLNIEGKEIENKKIPDEHNSISLNLDVPSGTYFVKVVLSTGIAEIQKVSILK